MHISLNMLNDTCQDAYLIKYAKMTLNMQIGICVKMRNYLSQAILVHYHNFCTVCALRVQFVL